MRTVSLVKVVISISSLAMLGLLGCANNPEAPSTSAETIHEARALSTVDCQTQGETQQEKDLWCGGGAQGYGSCQPDGSCVCSNMWCQDPATAQCSVPKVWTGNDTGYVCESAPQGGSGGAGSGGSASSAETCLSGGDTTHLKDAWCGDGTSGQGSCQSDGSCVCSTMWCLNPVTDQCTLPKVWAGNELGFTCGPCITDYTMTYTLTGAPHDVQPSFWSLVFQITLSNDVVADLAIIRSQLSDGTYQDWLSLMIKRDDGAEHGFFWHNTPTTEPCYTGKYWGDFCVGGDGDEGWTASERMELEALAEVIVLPKAEIGSNVGTMTFSLPYQMTEFRGFSVGFYGVDPYTGPATVSINNGAESYSNEFAAPPFFIFPPDEPAFVFAPQCHRSGIPGLRGCQRAGSTQQARDAWCGDGGHGQGECQSDGTCDCSPLWCESELTGRCNVARTWQGNDTGYVCPTDECGVIGGLNYTCMDCTGTPNGTAVYDDCGVCGGPGIPDGDCDCEGNVDLGCGCGVSPCPP